MHIVLPGFERRPSPPAAVVTPTGRTLRWCSDDGSSSCSAAACPTASWNLERSTYREQLHTNLNHFGDEDGTSSNQSQQQAGHAELKLQSEKWRRAAEKWKNTDVDQRQLRHSTWNSLSNRSQRNTMTTCNSRQDYRINNTCINKCAAYSVNTGGTDTVVFPNSIHEEILHRHGARHSYQFNNVK